MIEKKLKEKLRKELRKDLIEVNRRLSYDLWNVSCFNKKPSGLSPRLIFPIKRTNEEIRISEQEARILYCNILNNLNYFYSIETPTTKTYQQKGSTPLSALSDLSIYTYNNNGFGREANVEFKARNVIRESIRKDIEKIITEGRDGNWVHILEKISNKTLPSVFKKFIDSIKSQYKKGIKITIVFCICVIKEYIPGKKMSIIKRLRFDDPLFSQNISNYLEEFFCLDKNNNSNNIDGKNLVVQKDILKNNDWMIVEQ